MDEGARSLLDLQGEYTIIVENSNETYLITSPYGVCQYYYSLYGNQLFHDDTVLKVFRKSHLPWSWNWQALADLAELGNVLENDTLHPGISRLPAASILHFRKGGDFEVTARTWQELHPPFHASPKDALEAFNESTGNWISDNTIVSMSGGLDSRVILSSILKHGCKPRLLSMGFDDSTDVVVSRQIASALGLELEAVSLNVADYLAHGRTIVALTNGTKSAWDWHTYIYPRKANLDPNWPFYVGTNGEFARSHYFDMGIIAQVANIVPPLSLRYIWERKKPPFQKLKSPFRKDELGSLSSHFSREFTNSYHSTRVHRIVKLCGNELLSGLDRFYLEQRVRNFMGNGVKLYSETVSWRAPFLSRNWVSTIWNLGRHWKLGSNWHRFAIANNYPQLLDFPENGKLTNMSPRAPLLYWLFSRNSCAQVPYARCPEWFQDKQITEFVVDNASLLSELIDSSLVVSIVNEHKAQGNRTHAIAFLLPLIFWVMQINEQEI